MHIPDGWVDVPTSAVALVAATGATAVAARRAGAALREHATTFPAVIAAYLLVAQLLVLPVGLGTGAHLVGTGLATVLVGPATAIVCVAVVVVVQALLLADGGVTAIGLNVLNDGVVPALVTWAVWRVLRGSLRSPSALAGVAAAAGAFAAGLAVAAELAVGGTDVVSGRAVTATIGGAHLVVAVVEGVLTAAIVRAVLRLRPDMVRLGPGRDRSPTQEPDPTTAGGAR